VSPNHHHLCLPKVERLPEKRHSSNTPRASYKKPMIQHGGVDGSETETAQESFPDNQHDDYDDFGLSSTLRVEEAATSVEEEVFVSIPPLLSNNRASLNNPMQNAANATYRSHGWQCSTTDYRRKGGD
jgi:hypothetical protein